MPSKVCIAVILLFLVQAANIFAQESSIRVTVHDDYTQIPISSAQVTVSIGEDVIGAGYTGVDGIATIQITETHSPEPEKLPSSITLSQNYPNPFQSETRVELGIPEEQTISATVFNILGQRVANHQIPVSAGFHTLDLSLSHLATGVYFLRIDGRESETVTLFKMGSGFHQSGPSFSISPGRTADMTRIRSVTSGEYTVRVEKDRHDVFQTTLPIAGSQNISAPLSRNNLVEIQVIDADDNSVEKDLSIRSAGFAATITTPLALTLKSGMYKAAGEISDGVSLEKSFEIASRDTTIVLTFEEAGVLLEGDPATPAVASTYNLYIPLAYSPEMVSVDPELLFDGEVLRTEIQIAIDPDATVDQTNDFLDKYDARIVSMFENNIVYIIRVPDPGDIAALDQLLGEIQNEQIILFASKSVIVEDPMPEPDELEGEELQDIPDHITIPSDAGWIDHHLAARAHAAWNLRDLIAGFDQRPWILISDWFGDGAPGSGYDAVFERDDFGVDSVHSHGYHVLGIISGSHALNEGLSLSENAVTGIFPERLRVRVHDFQGYQYSTWQRSMALLGKRIFQIIDEDENARIILNTSYGHRSFPDRLTPAIYWMYIIRGYSDLFTPGSGLENRIIHFTAAGNVRATAERWDAFDSSIYSYAALGEMSINGSTIPNLINTFVIENRVNTLHQEDSGKRPLPGCNSSGSILGGNLSAMGSRVYSYGGCLESEFMRCIRHASDPTTSYMSGTSMASPQAAGLAAYVWSINPDLSVPEVVQIIRETSEDRSTIQGRDCFQTVQPVINAYGAVLAAGRQHALRTLLDVSRDGIFDETDIGIFLEEFTSRNGALDYSRFDLNGDGITGGDRRDQFDLDLNHEHSYINFDIEGISVLFDEKNLSDLEILCYYAYSDHYQGNTDTRRTLLEQLCLEPETPFVETTDVTRLTQTTITLGGNVLSDDRSQVNERGLVWSTSPDPNIQDNLILRGSGTGSFTSSISNLQPGETYYVRAFATNEAGTGYGLQIIVKTPDDSHNNETGTVSDIDGNVYNTVKIGDTWWMAENLRTSNYRNGDEIPNITNGDDWANHTEGAWVNYGNNPDNDNLYGKLYNWYATDDSRGLCPEGWSVPGWEEWGTLENVIGGTSNGFKLKSTRSDPDPQPRWTSPNEGATNESGFTGYPGGSMGFTGRFSNQGNFGFWWSTSSLFAPSNNANYHYLSHDNGNLVQTYSDLRNAFSVRCVMN